MLKMTINKEKGTLEFDGTDSELAVEVAMAMFQLIKNLRKSGRSDDFIRALVDTVMREDDE